MKTQIEKRTYERFGYIIPIEFSYFNQKRSFENYTLNNCLGGMNFRSDFFLPPGSIIMIRIKAFHPNGSCKGACKGLRTLVLSEVKWCQEVINANDSYYKVGVKYFEPDY